MTEIYHCSVLVTKSHIPSATAKKHMIKSTSNTDINNWMLSIKLAASFHQSFPPAFPFLSCPFVCPLHHWCCSDHSMIGKDLWGCIFFLFLKENIDLPSFFNSKGLKHQSWKEQKKAPKVCREKHLFGLLFR